MSGTDLGYAYSRRCARIGPRRYLSGEVRYLPTRCPVLTCHMALYRPSPLLCSVRYWRSVYAIALRNTCVTPGTVLLYVVVLAQGLAMQCPGELSIAVATAACPLEVRSLWSYALAMRSPLVLKWAISYYALATRSPVLPRAKSGTEIGGSRWSRYGRRGCSRCGASLLVRSAISLRACYAMSGTNVLSAYALATLCPVLMRCMVLPGELTHVTLRSGDMMKKEVSLPLFFSQTRPFLGPVRPFLAATRLFLVAIHSFMAAMHPFLVAVLRRVRGQAAFIAHFVGRACRKHVTVRAHPNSVAVAA
eukprot:1802007-Rhodomonas_salina.4